MEVYNVNNVSFLDLPKMANGKAKWQIWQCLFWAILDVQTNYGGLKVSQLLIINYYYNVVLLPDERGNRSE